jgi:hypothetical protein
MEFSVCCVCEHRSTNGFWFERGVGGWVGSDDVVGRPSSAALYVCPDCALYECEIYWSAPAALFSPDINDLDGEEPRLSRILRQYSGLEKGGSV